MNTFLKKHQHVASCSHRHFIKIHDFFGIVFHIDFFMENDSQNGPGKSRRGSLFFIFFATLSFMLFLCWIGLTFGSLLAPFGSLWAPFGSLLAHFWLTLGSLLVPFGSLLVPWARFWRSWRSIFSLLVPPSVIFHISFYNMDGILVPKPAHRHLHA